MERNKMTHLLFLLVVLLHVCNVAMDDCPDLPDNNLTWDSDCNRMITCVWNSTFVSEHTDAECTIDVRKITRWTSQYTHKTCKLEPIDVSKPALKKCSVDMGKDRAIEKYSQWTMDLRCNSMSQSSKMDFQPCCNIKLNPSGKPHINFTTVSWAAQARTYESISFYTFQLQWKQQNQSWSDASVKDKIKDCDLDCKTELDPDLLIQGETYKARTRVRPQTSGRSTWSDWSPTTTWVSPIGKTKPPPDVAGSVLVMIGAGTVTLALLLAVILFKTNKPTWVYIVKKIRGPPIPNPAISFLQDLNSKSWLSPHFTSESFHSFVKPVEIMSVEVTSTLDAVAPWKLEAALLEKMRSESSDRSSSSSFSNPNYSLSPAPPPPLPPISSLTAGNLQACTTDTPYGPVGNQGEIENAEQNKEEEIEILKLLSKYSKSSEAVQIISDYEKVEKIQMERMRVQSLGSGVYRGEEISQESLEADSINVSDGHDEEPGDKEEEEEEEEEERANAKEIDFQKQFGGTRCIFRKGSIQVCSDYERVQKLQADSHELPSLDSGVSSGGEEQVSQEESQEESPEGVDQLTESTSFLFPPPSCLLPCSLPSLSQLPLKCSEPGLSPAVLPLPSHILGRIALMSTSRSVEPSCDGYMPVKQEQC